jgi:16S rRNA (guanine966-N2)-methyltransferase
MRVIAGSAGGRTLRVPKNAPTRPTADRVKESLFSMIETLLLWGRPEAEIGGEEVWAGLRVLDLYAGSGALGIEALSRGAARATFVERDAGAVAAIRANLAALGLAGQAEVRAGDAARAVAAGLPPVDLVVMDPPYGEPDTLDVAARIAEAAWLAPDAVVVVEHSDRLALPAKLGNLDLQRERRYGETVLTLYARGAFDRANARSGQEGG